jgi:hypothetical protein
MAGLDEQLGKRKNRFTKNPNHGPERFVQMVNRIRYASELEISESGYNGKQTPNRHAMINFCTGKTVS